MKSIGSSGEIYRVDQYWIENNFTTRFTPGTDVPTLPDLNTIKQQAHKNPFIQSDETLLHEYMSVYHSLLKNLPSQTGHQPSIVVVTINMIIYLNVYQ